MAERDYVCNYLSCGCDGSVLCLDDLYKAVYSWFKRYHYDPVEIDHKEHKEQGNVRIMWEATKKMNDYVKFIMQVTLTVQGMKGVVSKESKKRLTQCNAHFSVTGFLLKDYEDAWTKSPVMKFMRECYDAFIIGSSLTKMEKELYQEITKFLDEMKSFLNVSAVH